LQFAGRDITFRIPYNLYSEMDVLASTNGNVFPEASFLHNVDKPLEMHRWLIRLTALDESSNIMEPQPETLEKRVKMRIQDVSKNENMTKSATTVETLQTANAKTWEYDEPYTFVRSEGFQVQVDAGGMPSICIPGGTNCDAPVLTPVTAVRVSINLQGYLIVVAPPTQER
jgi:hypothetical protein